MASCINLTVPRGAAALLPPARIGEVDHRKMMVSLHPAARARPPDAAALCSPLRRPLPVRPHYRG